MVISGLVGWLLVSLAAAAVLGRAIARADRTSQLHERRAALLAAAAEEAGAEPEAPRRTDPDPLRLRLATTERDGVALNG